MLREFAPAKVNLFLHVLGRRDDGYHLIDSMAVFAGVGDEVRAAPAAELTLTIAGPQAAGLSAGPDNLVLRAARLLAEQAGVHAGARLVLDKRLPVASGIGGGSADAAATLRLLNRLWSLDWPLDQLCQLAVGLGADVPACVMSTPVRMRGVGDELSPGPVLPAFGMVLVNPGLAVPTSRVFQAFSGTLSNSGALSKPVHLPASWDDAEAMIARIKNTRNDLQQSAQKLYPVIDDIVDALQRRPDCLLARMSGSGATCFGIFSDEDAAVLAADQLRDRYVWVWDGRSKD